MSDEYSKIEFVGVTRAQAAPVARRLVLLGPTDYGFMYCEHTPSKDVKDLPQNVFRVNFGGKNLAKIKTQIKQEFWIRTGKFPSTDVEILSKDSIIKTTRLLSRGERG